MQRRMSLTIKEYKFFRSFSQKFENWPKRKAEAIWRKMREKKIAGKYFDLIIKPSSVYSKIQLYCGDGKQFELPSLACLYSSKGTEMLHYIFVWNL